MVERQHVKRVVTVTAISTAEPARREFISVSVLFAIGHG